MMRRSHNQKARAFSFGETGDEILHNLALTPVFNPLASSATTTTVDLALATIPSYHSVTTTTPSTIVLPTTTPKPASTTVHPVPVRPASTSKVSAASSASSTPSAAADTTSSHKSSSGAAIGVTVTLLILAFCAAAFYYVRRKHIRDRLKKRSTWNPPNGGNSTMTEERTLDMESGNEHGDDASPYADDAFDTIDINEKEKQSATPLPANVTYNTLPQLHLPVASMPALPPALHAASYAPPRIPSPPPMSMSNSNNGLPALIASTPFAAVSIARGSVVSSLAPSSARSSALNAQVMTGTLVVVARTFVPSLPDELSIQTGEQVRVITRFDDGWAHVERTKSDAGAENGVVPVECLETVATPARVSIPAAGLSQEAVETWRLSKRKSSLVAPGPTQY